MSAPAVTRRLLPASATRRLPRWLDGLLEAIGLPLVLLGLWALSALIAPNRRFPAPWTIADAFVKTWVGDAFFVDVVPSVYRLLVGLALAIVIGIALGILVGSLRWLRQLVEPVFEFFRAIPPPMLVPLLAITLGIGDTAKIVVIVAGTVWPILLNTVEGVRSVDAVQRETATSYQLSPLQRVRYITLPSAAPQIMAGIRQSLSIGIILMVISEMTNASSGLGYRITFFQQNFQIPEMWSGIILLGFIGIALAVLFQIAEHFVLGWYRGLKETERA
ncbi:MAG: ABC transporter permease [Pseudolysinimonas sp.]|uniref:ABC transporter permease n=1 Tax=Pseudolysinimonas sp. TaxID=2680009 RepID=UPI003C732ED1